MKRIISILIVLFISLSNSYSQVKQVVVGVDGFTCSLCAKGVEGEFKSLDFVKSVKTNLKNTSFTLTFKKETEININELNNAVTDGGFSVRSITIIADGVINGDATSGYTLQTSNAPVLNLQNVNGKFSNGDKVTVLGSLITSNSSINISKIKKI